MTLTKVHRGQPMRIAAETFNAFIDVAQAHRDGQAFHAARTTSVDAPGGSVLVRNVSGVDQLRFAVLAIDGIVIGPTDNELEFQNRPAFDVTAPADEEASRIVILAEPIKAGKLGRAIAAGITPVRLDVEETDHEFAGAMEDVTLGLQSRDSGIARILWKDSGTGLKWAVVLFPAGGGGEGGRVQVGIVTSCNYSAGTAEVELATGSLGSLSGTGKSVEAYQGPHGWHVAGDEVVLFQSPEGVTPEWIIDQRIAGARAWVPPASGDLAPVQDNPNATTSCQ